MIEKLDELHKTVMETCQMDVDSFRWIGDQYAVLRRNMIAAQQKMHLIAFGVGGLCFSIGVVVGRLLYAR